MARDFRFFISDDNRTTWYEISGVNTWSFTIDSNEEDTSTFDNGACGSAMYTQRTGGVSLEGFYLVDSVTGTRDTGQNKLEVAATKVGYEAYRDFNVIAQPLVSGVRGTNLGGFMFTGQVALGDQGGSTTDVEPFSVDLIFEGKPTGSGVMNIF